VITAAGGRRAEGRQGSGHAQYGAGDRDTPIAPDHPIMERIKRRLDCVPALLGPARAVRLCGLPGPDDLEGALRVEGLLSLLAAHRLRATARQRWWAARRPEAVIWLGGGGLAALRGLAASTAPASTVVIWPGPDAADRAWHMEIAALARPPWLTCCAVPGPPAVSGGPRQLLLPDPAHALWGLLDHHAPGGVGGTLDLAGKHGWRSGLEAPLSAGPRTWTRAARGLLAAALPAGPAAGLGRRRLMERARRRLAGHEAVATDRVAASVFAALLGRRVLARGAEVAAYWRVWGGSGAPAAPLPEVEEQAA
jgi:hypothetical protein